MLTALLLQAAGDQPSSAAQATESFLDSLMTLGGAVTHVEMWLWLTLVVLILEVFTAGFFLGAFAVATLVSAGAAWAGLGRNGQLIVFALTSVASLAFIRPLFLKLFARRGTETNVDSLVGQAATVIDTVPAGGKGRVRLANEEWRATSSRSLAVGDAVRVLSVSGNTLTVDKA
ncbi:MAG: NfeD family protein [Planctomycetota bacterium]